METITLELSLSNTQNALDKFISDFISTYKSLLIRDNKKASGNLINSIKPLTIDFTSSKLTGSIKLAEYWKYVEYGRKPGDKFPLLPRPINGIKPTDKQLAFLISRKIARDGIKAGNQYSEALDLVWERNKDNISNAISLDLQQIIDTIKL